MNRLQAFFIGKNGIDTLAKVLLSLAGIVLITARFTRSIWLALLGLALLILFLARIFSPGIYKRQMEEQRFAQAWSKLKAGVLLRARMLREIKTHKYLRCPACRQRLRLPKGKGRVNVRCVRCRIEFIAKT